jgi:hypothetical protein
MASLILCLRGALLVGVVTLGACATSVSVSDLYQPNFGVRTFSHFDGASDPDPRAVSNGLYSPRPLQERCFFCSDTAQGAWAP